jgi:hypothetical protein
MENAAGYCLRAFAMRKIISSARTMLSRKLQFDAQLLYDRLRIGDEQSR